MENLEPSSHGSLITPSLASLFYHISAMTTFDFGYYVFEQVAKHVESYVVKLSIGSPI